MLDEKTSMIAITVGVKRFSLSYFTRRKVKESEENTDVEKNRITSISGSMEELESTLETILENENFPSVSLIGLDSQKWSNKLQTTFKNKFTHDKDVTNYAIIGCDFLLKNINDEAFKFNESHKMKFISCAVKLTPYLVLVKSQYIDFVKVSSDVSSLGKSYFNIQQMLSISKGLTGTKDLSEFMDILKTSPIYNKIMLCSENNLMKTMIEAKETVFSDKEDDDNKSMLGWYIFWLWCSNISQLAVLHCQNYKIKNIIFGEGWDITPDYLELINIFFKFYSGNKLNILFLRHLPFASSLGALLKKQDFQFSCRENFILSDGFTRESKLINLVLDLLPKLVPCSLLKDPATYEPLTQNLYMDEESRKYWIQCVTDNIRSGVKNKMTADSCTPKQIAFYKFQDMMIEKLDYMNKYPYCFGNLSMKIIQDTIEDCKHELKLFNSYTQEKNDEITIALQMFERHIKFLDRLNFKERQFQVALSLLGGNMFDWGAKEVSDLLNTGHFGFKEAIKKLPGRPWLVDNLDEWITQFEEKPYKMVAVFVDNYGFDLVMGIIPFVRELIKTGSHVYICANKDPVLNDATADEVKSVLKTVSQACSYIKEALIKDQIKVIEVPNSSCCTDFRFVSKEMANILSEVDLLVIEGMGRAIHTNLNAEFNVDCLKIGVVKNHWLSKKLGGKEFSCVFKLSSFICDTRL